MLMHLRNAGRSSPLPRFVVIAYTIFGAAGCASHATGSVETPSPQPVRCAILVPAPPLMADSLWLAITGVLRPAAGQGASTGAERFLFPLLYSQQSAPVCDSASRGRYAMGGWTDTSMDLVPGPPHRGPLVHISLIDARSGRDALDAGADVLVTSDATTLAYAAAQPNLSNVPLSWDRLYVLIEPGPGMQISHDSALALKMDLARDALHAEARPASDSGWWRGPKCATTVLPLEVPSRAGRASIARIVYDKQDDIARALSERLVALADARVARLAAIENVLSSADSTRAVGLDTAAFRVALMSGREAAYVIPLPRDPSDRCVELDMIHDFAPWLSPVDSAAGDRMVPLVETRGRAIVRRQRVGLSIDGAGYVYLDFGPPKRPQ